MAQPLHTHPFATSIGGTGELSTFLPNVSNGPLPVYRDAFAAGAMPASPPGADCYTGQLYGMNYWAARMIAVTRDDWVRQGCCRRKKEKLASPAARPKHTPQPDNYTRRLNGIGNWTKELIGSSEQGDWIGHATAA